MPRPQFSIRTLLWLTLVVAALLGGMAIQRSRGQPMIMNSPRQAGSQGPYWQTMFMPDGTKWHRLAGQDGTSTPVSELPADSTPRR
jgi:hypothetical protein